MGQGTSTGVLNARLARPRAPPVTILESRGGPILGVVDDALRATDFIGLGQTVGARYAGTAEGVSAIARDFARMHGFEPDQLEDEMRVCQRAFEARLFYGVDASEGAKG